MTLPDCMTPAMKRALRKAISRERGNICPIPGVHANAETMLIAAMDRRGFIAWDKPDGYKVGDHTFYGAPRISDQGRRAIAELVEQ